MDDGNGTYTVSTVRRRQRRLAQAVSSPKDAYNLVKPLVADAPQEHFYCLYLNTRNRLLAVELISVGSLNASIVHPREVFRPALQLAAGSIIVAHNHPSGETDPSEEDLALTRRLREAGDIMGIAVLDHIILANGSWTSLREAGHL